MGDLFPEVRGRLSRSWGGCRWGTPSLGGVGGGIGAWGGVCAGDPFPEGSEERGCPGAGGWGVGWCGTPSLR